MNALPWPCPPRGSMPLHCPPYISHVPPLWARQSRFHTSLCFYVLRAFLPSLPGCARCADLLIKTSPAVHKVTSRPIQAAPWPRLMPLDTLATTLAIRTPYMSMVSLRGGYLISEKMRSSDSRRAAPSHLLGMIPSAVREYARHYGCWLLL